MKKENNPLPDLLKYFRKKKHLTQEQVAKQLSVSRASYASYETGRIIPGMQHIMELSRILEHDFLFAYTLAVQFMKKIHTLPFRLCPQMHRAMNDLQKSPVCHPSIKS